ncbi:MAG TPA: pyridoxamine 5'-phosphate oxidase family protein [Thermoplasmata archaeon]|nr:pyridoxamine 5'-phosphate oxidase family protein [Thermoplasmata archaeon]
MRITRGKGGEYDLDEFLTRPLLAIISTLSPEGGRASVAWFIWEEGALWTIVEDGYNTFQRRVASDGRVAVAVVDFRPREGLLQHVSLRGNATVEPFDDARGSRLLTRYYRHLAGYHASPRSESGTVQGRLPMRLVRIVPDSVLLRGWAYRPDVLGVGAAQLDAGGTRAAVESATRP